VKVHIPSPLHSYTGGVANVEADGDTVDALLHDLDRQFPGLRFRVVDEQGRLREHMVVWLDGERCRDLTTSVTALDEVVLMQGLSGG
jgi:molybdopterin synthase sulfur carrier subunit